MQTVKHSRLRTPFHGGQYRKCFGTGRLRRCMAATTHSPDLQHSRSQEKQIESFGFKPNFHYDFELGSMIGSGSFGVVFAATHLKSGRRYAVKSIPKHFFGQYLEPHFVARVQHEVDVCRHMGQSLNVVHLVEAYEDDVCVDLVLELASGGSLWSRIKQHHFAEPTAARIIADMLRAVAQCHAKGVVVRDVKPENFLFLNSRENSALKMVDFGLAQYCRPGEHLTDRVGTPFYIAPEVLRQSYSFPADVWSAGVTAYQLLTGRFPWHSDPDWVDAQVGVGGAPTGSMSVSNKELWRAIMYGQFDFTWPPWDNIPDGARDLVQSMIIRDPQQRPTAAQLLHHPWLVEAVSSLDSWEEPSSSSSSSGSSSRNGNGSSSNGSGHVGSSSSSQRSLDESLVQRLQRYGTYGRLKQVALRQVAKIMAAEPDSQLQGLGQYFSAVLDPGGRGNIPCEALNGLLASGAYDLSEVEVRMLMSQLDLDRNGDVDYYEWLAALLDWSTAQRSSKWESWLRQVFDQFDTDGNGSISTTELLALLPGRTSPDLEGEEPYVLADTVPAVLRQVDADGDGHLSFEEFAALLQTDAADQLDLFSSRRRRTVEAAAVVQRHRA